jgi:hypothetical protein
MKIPKSITVETEVEVDIGTEDILNHLLAEPLTETELLTAINNTARFLNLVPDALVANLKPGAKETISNFFLKQSQRFANKIND